VSPREDDRRVDVVEIGEAWWPDESASDVIHPRVRISGWVVVGAVILFAGGAAAGWLAGRADSTPTSRATVAAAPARPVAPPPPLGCPADARVAPILPLQDDPLVAALHAWYPTFALVGGQRGTAPPLGRVCGAELTERDPNGITVDVTVVGSASESPPAHPTAPAQQLRLDDQGSTVRAEIVRVSGDGLTIDIVVTGPAGADTTTRTMVGLANDPRLDLT
jgi:hypothetical protein